MYAIQGCNKCIVNVSFLGPRDSVLFIEVSVLQGVRTALRSDNPSAAASVGSGAETTIYNRAIGMV